MKYINRCFTKTSSNGYRSGEYDSFKVKIKYLEETITQLKSENLTLENKVHFLKTDNTKVKIYKNKLEIELKQRKAVENTLLRHIDTLTGKNSFTNKNKRPKVDYKPEVTPSKLPK